MVGRTAVLEPIPVLWTIPSGPSSRMGTGCCRLVFQPVGLIGTVVFLADFRSAPLRRQSDADGIVAERVDQEREESKPAGGPVADGGGGSDYRVGVGWPGAFPRLGRPAVMSASQARDHPQQMRRLAWA